ncbi:DNA mismatch repair endonuclease MutL [Halorientalis litorea]|uniref:DNA mismatch repair endonuclease MutL n=1 Tax=Halorientalis litorea TaxID=2931977 RepID=UPI001FF6E942|nr:DNA mismatch repair endonuclease MutL [Halorientalis litorea]
MSEESGAIRELDAATVERIAAGEVVERPASAVKELVENSIDADATRVEVAVESGGKDGIRVTDDGVGMSESEVRAAVREHTTSKIRDIDDLESGVGTLGFRGEALHAIGAVSRLTIETRPHGGTRGTRLRVEGGEVTTVEPTGCPEGTTVEIADLFFNVPARRKYLKQDGTEFAHVNTVVTGYALANPDVRVSLDHDGRETFATTGDGDLQSAVMSVYGREVASAMVPVDGPDGGAEDAPLTDVSGLVSHPETNRASGEYVATYVDGRYVRSTAVRDAVVEAYGTQLAPDRYPFTVLFLSVPPGTVDVNVHPRKTEVRFADEEGVRKQVRSAVETALLEAGILRSSAPRGQSAPDQTEISPERDGPDDEGRATSETVADNDERGSETQDDPPTRSGEAIGPGDIRTRADADPTPATDEDSDEPRETPTTADTSAGGGSRADDAPEPQRTEDTSVSQRADADADSDHHRRFRPGTEQARLGDDEAVGAEREAFDRLPSMRVLGQFDGTYVVAETADGLVLVDQHAADERVNYERLRERLAGGTDTQVLADPVTLSLTAREAALVAEYEDALARLGFRVDLTDERTVAVRTVPDLVAEAADPSLLREVLSAFVTGESAAAETVEAAADDLLADMACYPSITGNTSLTEGSIGDLLRALDDCENPWACPHGRPVVVELDRDELAARFERDYPGHGGRRD